MLFISHCAVPYCSLRRGFFTLTLALIGQGAFKLALSNYFRDWEEKKNKLRSKNSSRDSLLEKYFD